MTKDFEKRGLFLMDESMVDLFYAVYQNFDPYANAGLDPMTLLRAISDYCMYGCLRNSHREDAGLMAYMDLIKDKLDNYIAALRVSGLAPQKFKSIRWGEEE